MGRRILQLYQLQTLDSEIDEITQQLAVIVAQLGESDALKLAKATLNASGQTLRAAQAKMQDLDLEVKSLGGKITSQEKLLYSGRVLNAKEAANLQDEVASLKRWHSDREEHLLESMVEFEEAEEVLKDDQSKFVAVEADWASKQKDLTETQRGLTTQLLNLKERRPAFVAKVTLDDLNIYEKLRLKKAGRAVSLVKNKVCQRCGITPSNSRLQLARSEESLTCCSGCGRIMYVS